jgi:hypothetical protein
MPLLVCPPSSYVAVCLRQSSRSRTSWDGTASNGDRIVSTYSNRFSAWASQVAECTGNSLVQICRRLGTQQEIIDVNGISFTPCRQQQADKELETGAKRTGLLVQLLGPASRGRHRCCFWRHPALKLLGLLGEAGATPKGGVNTRSGDNPWQQVPDNRVAVGSAARQQRQARAVPAQPAADGALLTRLLLSSDKAARRIYGTARARPWCASCSSRVGGSGSDGSGGGGGSASSSSSSSGGSRNCGDTHARTHLLPGASRSSATKF